MTLLNATARVVRARSRLRRSARLALASAPSHGASSASDRLDGEVA